MSMRPRSLPEVPEQTAVVARAAFPKGMLAMRVRDELGEVFADERFVSVFGVRGRPAISPGQLAMVTVLQFVENLTDRQAADGVRGRIDWKYCLGLELTDAGFDFSVLSEFRSRLVEHESATVVLDLLLERLAGLGLVKAGGRARTDSTHVLAAIRSLNRLELAAETLRAALEALAAAAPGWLAGHVDAEQVARYGGRADGWRLPAGAGKRRELAARIGADGYRLLAAVWSVQAPGWLRQVPAVQVLRQVWVQQYTRAEAEAGDGWEVIWRDASTHGLPPGRRQLISPYDTDARYSIKDGRSWEGYKIHLTETCAGPEGAGSPTKRPNLITNVATTDATVPDAAMTAKIHQMLAGKALLPAEHALDAGYASAELVLRARADHGVRLLAPVLADTSTQARTGAGYDHTAFTIDWDQQQARCPQGVTSTHWCQTPHRNQQAVVVTFPTTACRACPARPKCTRSRTGRKLTLRPRELHQALQAARAEQTTAEWQNRYKIRAGVEATIHQAMAATGIRRARYRGLAKTRLEHTLAATAINLLRLDAHWTGTPPERTRTTHLTRLDLTQAA